MIRADIIHNRGRRLREIFWDEDWCIIVVEHAAGIPAANYFAVGHRELDSGCQHMTRLTQYNALRCFNCHGLYSKYMVDMIAFLKWMDK